MDGSEHKIKTIQCLLTGLLLVVSAFFAFPGIAQSQSVPESVMAKQEEARSLEREISTLEDDQSRAIEDWVTISQQLQEIEMRIVNCYAEIDAAQAELINARRGMNLQIRELYMRGRQDGLVELMSATDVSDFLVRYEYLQRTVNQEAEAFETLRDKREKLQKKQDQLVEFKRDSARLARTSRAPEIDASIAEKKGQLAEVTSQIIAMQLPGTQSPAPTDFSPSRVFTEPDPNGFIPTGQLFSGYSSWYGNEFHGRPTASGEIFDQFAFTCAHKTLPFGTWLRVSFRGRSVIVKVNDRGPFVNGRMLDLSRGAAECIGLTGVQWVDCEILVPLTS